MSTDKNHPHDDDRRDRLQAARRRALLMIGLLTVLAAAIIAAAAWLISDYEQPSIAAEVGGTQVSQAAVARGVEVSGPETTKGYPQAR
jgi:hypothetical protein